MLADVVVYLTACVQAPPPRRLASLERAVESVDFERTRGILQLPDRIGKPAGRSGVAIEQADSFGTGHLSQFPGTELFLGDPLVGLGRRLVRVGHKPVTLRSHCRYSDSIRAQSGFYTVSREMSRTSPQKPGDFVR